MFITTLKEPEGKTIKKRLGKVKGEIVLKMGLPRFIVRELSAPSAEQIKAKEAAIKEMIKDAQSRGANAIISVEIKYKRSHAGGLFVLAATGEAVEIDAAANAIGF